MHNTITPNERLLTGELSTALSSPLCYKFTFITMNIKRKICKMYEEFISQLCMYEKAIKILAKGYLPISLISPSKLKEILTAVRDAIQTTNPDYDKVINGLHLYYDMKLVTFGIDRDRNLIIQSPVFHPAIYPAAADTVSDINSISSYCRQR